MLAETCQYVKILRACAIERQRMTQWRPLVDVLRWQQRGLHVFMDRMRFGLSFSEIKCIENCYMNLHSTIHMQNKDRKEFAYQWLRISTVEIFKPMGDAQPTEKKEAIAKICNFSHNLIKYPNLSWSSIAIGINNFLIT